MTGGRLIGKFHHSGAERSVEIGSVFFAVQEVLVRLEGSSGTGSSYDSYAERGSLRLDRRSSWSRRLAGGGIGAEAGKGDLAAASADVDAADGAGVPEGAFPAPPGPAAGEMPAFAVGSEPCPESALPAPEPAPFRPLPGPLPWPILVPPPAPPRPGLSPPVGDMASEPVLPLLGMPSLEPGWEVITTPALAPLPPLVGGSGGRADIERCAEAIVAAEARAGGRRASTHRGRWGHDICCEKGSARRAVVVTAGSRERGRRWNHVRGAQCG